MAITCISISIYDTTLPTVLEQNILDFAERSSIHWIYDGSDNKLLTMMPSRLEFDMEVSIEDSLDELLYDYLFTGNETRYSVVMRDQNERVLWRGFLLPEEYTEPYETGTYFIHFTATDGLGRLKGNNLPNSFYRAKQSVIKTIADCLRLTGLALEIWIDPAIEFEYMQTGEWELIYLDAQEYNTGDKPENAYDILNSLLEETGNTLFQQNERWYVQGINKRGKAGLKYRRYDAFGNFINSETEFQTAPRSAYWYATPSISIKPPFKEVSVKENLLPKIDLFPEAMVSQPWTMSEAGQNPPLANYWKQVGLGDLTLQEASAWEFKPWEDEEFEQDANVGLHVTVPGIPPLASWPATVTNYITLYKDVYIKGEQYIDFDFVWDFRVQNPTNNNLDEYINEGNWYEVILNGETIISNRHLFPGRNNFKWSSNDTKVWLDGYTRMTCSVKVRKFWLEEGGLLNIKFYTINTSSSPPQVDVRFKQLAFTYRKDINSFFKKRRIIDYTTSKELSIQHGGSVFDQMRSSFMWQSKIPETEFTQIPFSIINPETAKVSVSFSNWVFITANLLSIYVRRENSDYFEYIYQVRITGVLFYHVQLFFEDGHVLQEGDQLFVRPGVVGSPQNAAAYEARERWQKTTNSNGYDRLGNVLAELYHDIYPSPTLTMEGTVKGLLQPKEVLQYELKKQMRDFIPVRIDMKPNENEASVTLMEYKNENITDYGG